MKAKKFSKRIIAAVLSVMMVLGCFALSALTAGAAGETTVNIHYFREDGNYGEWDVWAWADGLDGAGHAFVDTDGNGAAVCTVTGIPVTSSMGFIIRKPDWSAKDPEPDRYVDLSKVISGTVDVYCTSGEEAFEVDYNNAVTGLKMSSAACTTRTNINYTFTMALEDGETLSAESFVLKNALGEKMVIADVALNDNRQGGSITTADQLDYTKDYTLTFREVEVPVSMPDYFSSEEFENEYSYLRSDLGANYTKDATTFRVWAPTANKIELNLYENGNGGEAYSVTEMTKSVRGTWVSTVEGDLNKVYYTYTAYFDGKTNKDIVDPYARTVGVNGKRGMVIDLDSTDPEGWDQDQRHTYANATDMVIYELHVRDFSSDPDSGITNTGKYIAFTENGTTTSNGIATGIDHLKDLGITTVHILPSYDFGSVDETKLDTAQYNWGYDPVNYNAPEGSYSTDPYHGEVRVNEYKQMVQALHNAGIGVVMDVVYNHTYNTQYCFNQLVPGYFYRPDSNGSGCGNDVASERIMVSKFISDSVKYWADEYHLDGFRFDLMGLIDVDTMNNVRKEVDEIDSNIFLYGEGWTLGTKVTKPDTVLATQRNSALTPGVAYFSDTIRDGIRGNVFDSEAQGYVGGGDGMAAVKDGVSYSSSWSAGPEGTVNYDSCHDNHTIWDRLNNTNPENTEDEKIAMNKLSAAIIFTSQGVPFIMSGEEFLRAKTLEDGTSDHNSYASPDSVNLLDYSRIGEYSDVYEYYQGLIKMRKAFSEFRMLTPEAVEANLAIQSAPAAGVIAFQINGNLGQNSQAGELAHDIYVVYNRNNKPVDVTLPDGEWAVVANGQTAGATPIETVNGSVSADPISAMVLVKDYQGQPNVSELTDEATGINVYGCFGREAKLLVAPTTAGVDNEEAAYDVKLVDANDETEEIPLNGAIQIEIPCSMKNLRVVHVDNGSTQDMKASYIDGSYWFTATHLSMFALISSPVAEEPVYDDPTDPGEPSQPSDPSKQEDPSKTEDPSKSEEPSKTDEPSRIPPVDDTPKPDDGKDTSSGDVPNTGDTSALAVFVLAAAACGAAVFAFSKKRSK